VHILVFMFVDTEWEDRRFCAECSRHSLNIIYSYFLQASDFNLWVLFPNIWTLHVLDTLHCYSVLNTVCNAGTCT
jgi:hypothetical protein